MEHPFGFRALFSSETKPLGVAGLAASCPASSSSHRVKDRSVQRRINNLVVGHFRPFLPEHHPNFADPLRKVAFDRQLVLNGKAA